MLSVLVGATLRRKVWAAVRPMLSVTFKVTSWKPTWSSLGIQESKPVLPRVMPGGPLSRVKFARSVESASLTLANCTAATMAREGFCSVS